MTSLCEKAEMKAMPAGMAAEAEELNRAAGGSITELAAGWLAVQ